LTSRTTKINEYDPDEAYDHSLPHPLGDWKGPKTHFKYTKNLELLEKTYTVRQIKEFIYEYPKNVKGARLKLWIQKAPTDNARRYPSEDASKCRFKDCPIQMSLNGSILHGHYRVAFDETWHKYGENADPYMCAGFAHLYCMERFLNFPDVCRRADVEVDCRALTNEPKGKFAGGLGGSPEVNIARNFVERCKAGRVKEVIPNYPDHNEYKLGEPKPHKQTLTYVMTDEKCKHRPRAQKKQFEERGLKASHIMVHKGDLEMIVREKTKNKQA
jgi:hypothetical protein